MMHVKNAVYEEITPRWSEITLPLKEGTPMSKTGKIVNGSGAAGIVPQTITVKPVVPAINLLVGGSVSLAEVNAAYGTALTKAAKESMNGIAFYGEDGTPEPDPLWDGEPVPGTLPAVESTDAGKVLTVDDDGNWVAASGGGGGGGVLKVGATYTETTMTLDKTWKEIHDAPFAVIVIQNDGSVSSKNTMLILSDEVSMGFYTIFAAIPSQIDSSWEFAIGRFETNSENGYPSATFG